MEPTDGTKGNTGWFVGTEVIKTIERGRGTYVTEDVPKGSIVWKTKYTAKFSTANQFRTFLKAFPPFLACEVINWSYTRVTPSGDFVVCTDLEPGALTNQPDTPEELTMELGTPENPFENTGCYLEFYAPRDIPKGEELLMDYGFSERNAGWVAMGLARMPMKQTYKVEEEDEEEEEENGEDDEDYSDDEGEEGGDSEEEEEEEEAEL